jgi:hypothetical protein
MMSCALMCAVPSAAQQPAQPASQAKPSPEAAPSTKAAGIPLRVQVVISRYEGERKVSSMPYALAVNGSTFMNRSPASLNMTAQVPVPSIGPAPPTYHEIGTKISCYATTTDDDRIQVSVTISDTSVYGDGQTPQLGSKLPDIPSFRSFSSSETLTLKDGQTAQFTAATDKLTGETVKVDVTLNVLK